MTKAVLAIWFAAVGLNIAVDVIYPHVAPVIHSGAGR